MEYWSNGFWNNGMVGIENLIDLFPLLIPSIPSFPYSIPAKVQAGSATFQVALNVDGHKKPHISKY
jgi:hypothetical protein